MKRQEHLITVLLCSVLGVCFTAVCAAPPSWARIARKQPVGNLLGDVAEQAHLLAQRPRRQHLAVVQLAQASPEFPDAVLPLELDSLPPAIEPAAPALFPEPVVTSAPEVAVLPAAEAMLPVVEAPMPVAVTLDIAEAGVEAGAVPALETPISDVATAPAEVPAQAADWVQVAEPLPEELLALPSFWSTEAIEAACGEPVCDPAEIDVDTISVIDLSGASDFYRPIRFATSTEVEAAPEPSAELLASLSPATSVSAEGSGTVAIEMAAKPSLSVEPSAESLTENPLPTEMEQARQNVLESAAEVQAESIWQAPTELVGRLERLTQFEAAREWAAATQTEIASLTGTATPSADQVTAGLANLKQLLTEARTASNEATDLAAKLEWKLTQHAVQRWLEVQQLAHQLAPAAAVNSQFDPRDPARLTGQIDSLKALVSAAPNGAAWNQFLQLDPLQQLVAEQADEAKLAAGQELAQTVISRLDHSQLTAAQVKFVAQPQVAALQRELRNWAAGPVELATLVNELQAFEHSASDRHGRSLAAAVPRLTSSTDANWQQLGQQIDNHYRNHNVRVAVSADLLNRLLPQPTAEEGDVNDVIAGTQISGRSLTSTKLQISVAPTSHRLSLNLVAKGEIDSRTCGTNSGVIIHNDSTAYYAARVPLQLTQHGLVRGATQVDVTNNSFLRGIETPLDPLPILGDVAQSYARSRYEAAQPLTALEVEERIRSRVLEKLEAQLVPQLDLAQTQLEKQVFAPLAVLGLKPEVADLQTTQERLVIRTRLATPFQMAAYTPRPEAPGDSQVSVQVHESALNNVLRQLKLNGERHAVCDLPAVVAQRLGQEPLAADPEIPTDIYFTFASEDPILVRLLNGQMELTLRLAAVENGDRFAEDVSVRVFYRPELNAYGAQLVRDGGVQLRSEQNGPGTGLMLRAMFLKVFPKNKPLTVVDLSWLADPRLAGLGLTQFDIRDGWAGLAMGPARSHSGEDETEVAARP